VRSDQQGDIGIEDIGPKVGTVRHSSVPIPTSVANKGKTLKRKEKEKKKKRKKEKVDKRKKNTCKEQFCGGEANTSMQ
jgi:hypothetical protein